MYAQIYEYFRSNIETGQFKRGMRLPSVRILAAENGISKITVEQAYTQLATEGYIKAHNRSPYEVVGDFNEGPSFTMQNPVTETIVTPLYEEQRNSNQQVIYNFGSGAMDPEGFDYGRWKRMIGHVLRKPEALLAYGDQLGEPTLRKALMQYLESARGVKTTMQQIVVGNGTQTMLAFIASLLARTEKKPLCIAVKAEDYNDVGSIFEDYGFSVYVIRPKEDIINSFYREHINVYYCTPSHDSRTGEIMPITRRKELLQWAYETNSYIIEDDYDSELRYYGRPIMSLQGLDTQNRVIYVSAPSKVLPPSIRLSYMVLPPVLLEQMYTCRSRFRQTASGMEQLVFAEYIFSGEWGKQIRRLRKHYQEKSKYMVKLIERHLGDKVKTYRPEGGVYVELDVTTKKSARDLQQMALDAGCSVRIVQNRILLSFSSIATEKLEAAILQLADAWRTM